MKTAYYIIKNTFKEFDPEGKGVVGRYMVIYSSNKMNEYYPAEYIRALLKLVLLDKKIKKTKKLIYMHTGSPFIIPNKLTFLFSC